MLSGTVKIGGHEWDVHEEKRGGPQTQLLSLTAVDSSDAEMQIRLGSGQEAKSLDDVALYAATPSIRWFTDAVGHKWEARIVVHSEPEGSDRELIKFISDTRDVKEGDYSFTGGLGLRSDAELRRMLAEAE